MNNIKILEEFIERYRCSNSNVEILYKEVEALENLIEDYKELNDDNNKLANDLETILDLYKKEKKEKNKNLLKELEKYANWHIEHLTEDISDYIDDDRKGNASIIGEFKEEREHWKDIIRIMNNEKTYIVYKN